MQKISQNDISFSQCHLLSSICLLLFNFQCLSVVIFHILSRIFSYPWKCWSKFGGYQRQNQSISMNSAVIWDNEFLFIKKKLHLTLSPFPSFINPFTWLTGTLCKALCWVWSWIQKRRHSSHLQKMWNLTGKVRHKLMKVTSYITLHVI